MKNKLKPLMITALLLTSTSLLNACAKTTVNEPDTTSIQSSNSNDMKQGVKKSNVSAQIIEEKLTGTWQVERITTRPVIDRSPAQLIFLEDNKLSGSASCNNMFSNYLLDSKKATLSFGPVGVTRKMCLPALMEQETRFLSALPQVNNYQIREGMLNLFDKDDVLIFRASRVK